MQILSTSDEDRANPAANEALGDALIRQGLAAEAIPVLEAAMQAPWVTKKAPPRVCALPNIAP